MPISFGPPNNNIVVGDIPIFIRNPKNTTTKHVYKSVNIAGNPPPEIVKIPVNDVIGLYPKYLEFRLNYSAAYTPVNTIPWIKPFTYNSSGIPDSGAFIPLTENGTVLDFPLELQNVNLLALGNYTYRQTFTVQGRSNLGFWYNINTCFHDTILHITNELAVFDPKTLIFNHAVGTTLPSKSVTLQGNSWKLIGNSKFVLTSEDANVIIQPLATMDGIFQQANGSGTGTVFVGLTDYFENESETLNTTDYLPVKSGNEAIGNVIVKVKTSLEDVFTMTPETLYFLSQKNVSDSGPQNIFFECNTAYVLEFSAFLNATVQTLVIDGEVKQVIVVIPIASFNLSAGIYVGYVRIKAIVNGVEVVKTTIVTYEITDVFQFGFDNTKPAFTLDNEFVKFSTYNQGTYMQLTTTVKMYDFYTDTETDHVIQEKIGLFKGQGKVNIGKMIHKLFKKTNLVNENVLQYIPALVALTVQERTLSDDEFVRAGEYGNIKFIAGLSKDFWVFGFLKINHLNERVTANSYKFLNIYVPSGQFNLVTYKNNTLISEEQLLPSEGKTMTIRKTFEEFNPGDLIQFMVRKAGNNSSRIGFVVFPEGKYSNALNWEDEFLLKQALECTGNYNIKSNLDFLSQKNYNNLVEHLSHLEITKVVKISINTGWLMQSDIDTIESLMKSKKVWIQTQGKTIFLVPISETITNADSERELIDYTLEFQINPTYNEETYRL